MSNLIALGDYLGKYGTQVVPALYSSILPVSNVNITDVNLSEVPSLDIVRSRLKGDVVTRLFESLGVHGTKDLNFLVLNGSPSLLKVAEISEGRIEDDDFQDRLVGAIVYRALQVSKLLQGGIHTLHFPVELIDHIGEHHVDEGYMEEKFSGKYKGPVVICREDELLFLQRLKLP